MTATDCAHNGRRQQPGDQDVGDDLLLDVRREESAVCIGEHSDRRQRPRPERRSPPPRRHHVGSPTADRGTDEQRRNAEPEDGHSKDRGDEHSLGYVSRCRRNRVGQRRVHDVDRQQVADDRGEPGPDDKRCGRFTRPARRNASVKPKPVNRAAPTRPAAAPMNTSTRTAWKCSAIKCASSSGAGASPTPLRPTIVRIAARPPTAARARVVMPRSPCRPVELVMSRCSRAPRPPAGGRESRRWPSGLRTNRFHAR